MGHLRAAWANSDVQGAEPPSDGRPSAAETCRDLVGGQTLVDIEPSEDFVRKGRVSAAHTVA
jgi:hypothetical protein